MQKWNSPQGGQVHYTDVLKLYSGVKLSKVYLGGGLEFGVPSGCGEGMSPCPDCLNFFLLEMMHLTHFKVVESGTI